MPKVSSITRVLEIVEAVSYAQRPLSPLELSKDLDIPKPTIHRLIQTLVEEGFIGVDIGGGIIPGKRVRNLSIELWQQKQFFQERQLILQGLVDDIKESCGIAVPHQMSMLHTNRVQTDRPIQIYLPAGSQSPMWCTATGKLYLSLLPTQTRAKMLRQLPLDRFTENTFTDVDALTAELDTIAKSGVGIDNEEFISEALSVAVPILDKDSRYLASLFVNAPTIRVSLEALQAHVPRLRVAAQDIQTLCYEFEMK